MRDSRLSASLIRIVACGATVACAANVAAERKRSVALGEHYQLICHFENVRLANAALETAEAVWPLADRLSTARAATPIKPFDIHLYRTASDYQQAEAALTGGRFRDTLAFSHGRSQASHIAIQPPCTDATLEIIGLPALTRYQIAHEAFHLASLAATSGDKNRPRWFKEGGATWAAQTAMEAKGWSDAATRDPYSATRMDRVRQLLRAGTLPTPGDILRKGCNDLARNDQYAVYWTFMRFMTAEARNEDLAAIVRHIERQATRPTSPLSEKRLDRLDSDFAAHVRSLAPLWREETRSLHVRGDTWTQIAFADEAAIAWRSKPVGRPDYRVVGSLEFLPNPGRRMDLLLGKDEAGHICVAFVRGFGLHVTRYWAADARREDLGIARAEGFEPGRPVRFALRLADGRLDANLNGQAVLTVPLGDKVVTGAWGLSAQPNTAGIWRGVRVSHGAE